METNTHEIGSIWRKWDLHLHTASSYDYKYKQADADNVLIQSLTKKNISAVAITDHFVIDKERIDNLRNLAPEIIFFPGVELRTDKGDTNIHVILIFDNEINLQNLCEDFDVFKRGKGKEINNNDRIYWDYNDICKFAKEHNALISIHAGRKSNGVDDRITNALDHNQAVKEEFAKSVDIFEMGQLRDLEDYRKFVFPSIKNKKPMIMCSDNHNPNDYNSSLWVKADLTFNGLKQIIHEPERVSLDFPNLLNRVNTNPLKFIKSLSIRRNKSDNSNNSDIWYDNVKIDMNPGLVAIIGKKGSGKSAITDIIGLCADTHNDYWSFLTSQKFRKPTPYNLSSKFEAQITWSDNSTSEFKNLDSDVDKNQLERVKYIPQNFLENICTTEDDKEFEKELKTIIFQHLPEDQKYGKQSIDEIVDYLSFEIQNSCNDIKTRINEQNKIIIGLEEKKSPDYEERINNALKIKKAELRNLSDIEPKKVEKPDNTNSQNEQKIQEEIKELTSNIKQIEDKIFSEKTKLNLVTKKIQDLSSVKDRLERFYSSYQELIKEVETVFDENDLSCNELIKVVYNKSVIEDKLNLLKKSQEDINKLLDQDSPGSLYPEKDALQNKLKELENKLSEPYRLYQKYLSDLKQWQMKFDSINGNKETSETIIFYEAQLEYLKEHLDIDLNTAISEREKLVLDLISKKQEIVEKYKELYKPIIEFINKYKDELKSYPMEMNASFKFIDIQSLFFDMVSQQAAGSFYGKEQGSSRLTELCDKTDMDDKNSIYNFAFSLNEMLKMDKRNETNIEKRSVVSQLKKGHTKSQLYELIYNLDYIEPLFKLKLDGKDLTALSPGERGALLLLFYLFIDMDDKPLIIDQPEENLDNETVYNYLVDFIKKAKYKRQIIMVTHNPNLAVVCDAEQIIRMNIEKEKNNRVSFISGAIENPEINKSIVNILEGTYPAFRNRDDKYLNKNM